MDSDSGSNTDGSRGNDATSSKTKTPVQSKGKPTKHAGSFKYKSRFQKEWTAEWPFVHAAPGKDCYFTCTVCKKEVSCAHQGKKDVTRHIDSATHVKLASSIKKQPKLNFVQAKDEKVISAEVKMVHL